MANSIFTDLIGRDLMSPVLSSGEKAINAFASNATATFAKLGAAIAAAFTVRAIYDFVADSIKAASESEEAWAKWEATQRAAGDTIRLTSAALADLSQEMMRNTRFGDEAVVNAASLLSIYENLNSEGFERTIELAADMASLFGTDLEGATRQLGRALDNPLQGMALLRRSGVVLNESTKELIKSLVEQGKTAEAQGVLFEALEKKFNGLSEAMGDTALGRLEKLKNAWGELQEKMGDLALPTVSSFIAQLNKELQEPIIIKWRGEQIFHNGAVFQGEVLETPEATPTEEEDARKWEEFYAGMLAQEKLRTELEEKHLEGIEKSRMEREGIEERAQEADRAKDIESAEQRRIEGLVAAFQGGRIQPEKALADDKSFSAAFEGLTDLNRRITQAAASGTAEDKVKEAIVEVGNQQIQAVNESKKVQEETRDAIRNLPKELSLEGNGGSMDA